MFPLRACLFENGTGAAPVRWRLGLLSSMGLLLGSWVQKWLLVLSQALVARAPNRSFHQFKALSYSHLDLDLQSVSHPTSTCHFWSCSMSSGWVPSSPRPAPSHGFHIFASPSPRSSFPVPSSWHSQRSTAFQTASSYCSASNWDWAPKHQRYSPVPFTQALSPCN